MPRSVVWHKRDLRTFDHAPLARAAAMGEVVALYVYEPIVLHAPEHDSSHLMFVNECLSEVRDQLRALGTDVIIRSGEMIEVLDRLHAEINFDHLFSHEETGLLSTYTRDRAVRAWCKNHDVKWIEIPQHGVFRPVGTRDGWSQRWHDRMSEALTPEPKLVRRLTVDIQPGEIRTPQSLGLPASTRGLAQGGGSSAAWSLLESFLSSRGERYQREMSGPVESWESCSRISPHLAYGSISLKTCVHAARVRLSELEPAADDWRRSIGSFEKRLAWHCHFIQKLEDEPRIELYNVNRAFDGLRTEDPSRWTDDEHDRFEKYCSGRTGYPIIDAGIRSLHETGWITFRMRAMLMSFAAYHLWLHWKPVATFLARHFLDFEPGIHFPQCQMQSGVTGINTIRIYSPIKQTHDHDADGTFIRRWVPEIASLPNEHLAEPWHTPSLTQHMARCVIGESYPHPIVDHTTAYKEAQRRIFEARDTALAKRTSAAVFQKHGSRKNDRR